MFAIINQYDYNNDNNVLFIIISLLLLNNIKIYIFFKDWVFKGIVHPKNIVSSFTEPYIQLNNLIKAIISISVLFWSIV